MPSGDEYCAMLEDGKVAGTKVLQGVMVREAAGICCTIAPFCEPGFIEVRTALGRFFVWVSTDCGPQQPLGVVSSTLPGFTTSGLV